MMKALKVLPIFILLLCSGYLFGQSEEAEAIKEIRNHFFDREYEFGIKMAEKHIEQFPDLVELHAWHVANLARSDKDDEALKHAQSLLEKFPENPWSKFALVRALSSHNEKGKEALDLMDEMVSENPNSPYFHWLKAVSISNQKDKEESIDYIREVLPEFKEFIPLRSLLGSNLFYQTLNKQGEEIERKFDEAIQIFSVIRKDDQSWVDAYYLPAYYLNTKGDPATAFEMIEKATQLTTSYTVHSLHWRILRSKDEFTQQQKLEKVEEGIAFLNSKRTLSPEMMFGAANQYKAYGDTTKQLVYEEKIRKEYPNDVYAEWVLVERYRTYRDENRTKVFEEQDPKAVKQYTKLLWDFINKPNHIRERLLGDAYRSLFTVMSREDDINEKTFLDVVNGMVKYEGINVHISHGLGAEMLAEKTKFYDRAKEITEEGFILAEKKINQQNERGSYDNEEEYQKSLSWYKGIIHEALGWVYFQEGKLDSAEKELSISYSLYNENPKVLYRLGQLQEKKGNKTKAENFYRTGVKLISRNENPNVAALKQLYIEKNGSAELFDEYLDRIKEDGAKDRKSEIISEVIKKPEKISSFELKNLNGESIASSSLNGKISVINIWGIWCGPCVAEMPDIQRLYEKYKNNPDIEIFTINNDPDIQKVKDWMKERGYTFPVLRDDGYLGREGIYVFPTSFFIDENKEVKFKHEGYTKNLVEEFTWRIDFLSVLE